MKKAIITILLFNYCVIALGQNGMKDKFLLFYLGGQSNMDGYGYISKLPDSLNKTIENVYIFHGNPAEDNQMNGGIGKWTKLKPGHGTGFSADTISNHYSDRFGVELSFTSELKQLYPKSKIAIVKYSRTGTALDSLAGAFSGSWDPNFSGINQYNHFLSTVKNAFSIKDIDNDGKDDKLIPKGIIWMQGESDADYSEEVAKAYYFNLSRIVMLQRAALHDNKLPVVIGKITDYRGRESGKTWQFLELVQDAQEKFAQNNDNVTIVRSTKYYAYSDPWHYDSAGFIDLGVQFAKAIKKLDYEN